MFQCNICGRELSRRQRLETHLTSAHGHEPPKRQRMLYNEDESIPVPISTMRRKNAKQRAQANECATEKDIQPDIEQDKQTAPVNDGTCEHSASAQPIFPFGVYRDVSHDTDDETESSDESTDSSNFEDSSNSSDNTSSGDISDEVDTVTKCNAKQQYSDNEVNALCIVSLLIRDNVSTVTGKNIIKLLKALCPESEAFKSINYEQVIQSVSKTEYKVFHYCAICANVFPADPNVFECTIEGCEGLRYIGSRAYQVKANRQPRYFFVMADVKKQLKSMLERNDVWSGVQKTKDIVRASIASPHVTNCISDIVDGQCYRDLCKPGHFLSSDTNISAIFNTDGVPLYSSSSVKLWPIFLAINELPPSERFAKGNMILAGLWQGKGNPPFMQYIATFGDEMVDLYNTGVELTPGDQDERIQVRLGVFLGTMDLQAKSYVLNMSHHNGASGCITCEEPGKTVQQGKGSTRCYPYRPPSERHPIRQSDDLKFNLGPQATTTERVKGICGVSGLCAMPWFDIVLGIVPDYMHGVLLGVTKTLLKKWFSSTNSGKEYFIGKHMKKVSQRLQCIKPPNHVERLPRDLEKHYLHYKATEYQTWLLFYGPVCLNGFLPDVYFHHFLCLSEAIHILLGDCITDSDVNRAEALLDKFYRQFPILYGEGSCGLNVHNIGIHLVQYVRWWGPLFSWSTFGFEDSNADILNAVHGTGDATKQILKYKDAQFTIQGIDLSCVNDRQKANFLSSVMPHAAKKWKRVTQTKYCGIAGALKTVNIPQEEIAFVLNKTDATSLQMLRKVLRVEVKGSNHINRLYSKEYSRMNKRICYMVLCANSDIISVDYFLLNTCTNIVYAIGYKYAPSESCFLSQESGYHVLKVKRTGDLVIFQAQKITEQMFFMSIGDNQHFVSRIPNLYGHGVFK